MKCKYCSEVHQNENTGCKNSGYYNSGYYSLPNFDAKIFEETTGINIEDNGSKTIRQTEPALNCGVLVKFLPNVPMRTLVISKEMPIGHTPQFRAGFSLRKRSC